MIELTGSNGLAGCNADMPICEQQLDLSNEVNNEIESRLVIRSCPEVILIFNPEFRLPVF